MLPHTQNQLSYRAEETPAGEPATYGDLMSSVLTGLDRAIAKSTPDVEDVEQAHAEVLGYERFLRVSGHHLELLAALAQTESQAWRTLGRRLADLPFWEDLGGYWSQAATSLGAAHDLVATHLGDRYSSRTPELEPLVGGPETAYAALELVRALEHVASAGETLLQSVTVKHRRSRPTQPRTTRREFNVLHPASRYIALYGRATRWDLRAFEEVPESGRLLGLSLPPAMHLSAEGLEYRSSRDALRALRIILHRQARGESGASPESLRDLAELGMRVNDPARLRSPLEDATGLERLEVAHHRDQVTRAHEKWAGLADEFASRTRGLSRAPQAYALAIAQLRADVSPEFRDVLAHSLPGLGRHAGEVVLELTRHGALIGLRRERGSIHSHWRALDLAEGERLASLFSEAAELTPTAVEPVHGRTAPSPNLSAHGPTYPFQQARPAEVSR